MKIKYLSAIIAIILGVTSCIKDEPLNRETDIDDFRILDDSYVDKNIDTETEEVFLYVTDDINLEKVKTEIAISHGATISPASGSVQDFSKGPLTYRVVSEDGKYSKNYLVTVIRLSTLDLKFDFENWQQTNMGYHNMQIKTSEGYLVKMWDSGNPGIAIVNKGKEFPTRPSATSEAYSGQYAAKLETSYGGVKIGNIQIPIFSGSLFYGRFSLAEGIGEPRKCLHLGRLHPKKQGKPLTFTGYYKYKKGSPYVYLENGKEKEDPNIDDAFSIYAVLFKVTKGESYNEYLNGITIMDSEKIVARADWKPETANQTDELVDKGFTRFTIPFEYKNGEELDYDKYDYKLTIMFASSKDGNEYRGAIGSTLIVDDVEVICDKPEEEEGE